MLDQINKLMQRAVELYGRDRYYKIHFEVDEKTGANTPIVSVTWPDGSAIAELFLQNDEIFHLFPA
jgi:hypothetical protein